MCLDNLYLSKNAAIATKSPILYQWRQGDSIPALLRCEMLCFLTFSDPASKGLLTDCLEERALGLRPSGSPASARALPSL